MRLTIRARRALAAVAAVALMATGTLSAASAAHAAPPPPAQVTKMAALGDSITQASMTCSSLVNCPSNSWSTGTSTSVGSHLLKLRAVGATSLVGYNNAVGGSLSGALNAQAAKAVTQGAQYVTIEIGANDACTRTVSAMTPTATFKANVQAALQTLAASPTAPQIFVASIPSLQRLYDINKTSVSARLTWGLLRICQSMLANPSSTNAVDVQRRAAVQQRVNEYNQALLEACNGTANCRYDGGALATHQFQRADISTRDYFHPSLSGQALIANLTWPKTQWVSP